MDTEFPQPSQGSTNFNVPGGQAPRLPVMHAIPQVAQDEDQLEGEWAEAVETLFERVGQDPRQLVTQLAALKADYLAKRYGRRAVNQPNTGDES